MTRRGGFVAGATSGDAALDRERLEAIASDQLAFRPCAVPKHPLTFEQPSTYEIR